MNLIYYSTWKKKFDFWYIEGFYQKKNIIQNYHYLISVVRHTKYIETNPCISAPLIVFFSWDDMWTNCSKMCIYNRCAQHRNDSNAQVNHTLARTRNFVGHRCFNKTLNATDFCVYTLCMMIFNDIDIKWLTVEFKNHIFQLSKFTGNCKRM